MATSQTGMSSESIDRRTFSRLAPALASRDPDWIADTEDVRREFTHHLELDLSVTGPLV
jgi:hypothetical protein